MAQLANLPGTLDIIGYGGDDFTFDVWLWQDKEQTIPAPIAGTSKAQIRRAKHDIEKWDLVVVVDEENDNHATITAPASVTSQLAELACSGSFYNGEELVSGLMFMGVWDWQVTDGGVKTYTSGKAVFVAEVTR